MMIKASMECDYCGKIFHINFMTDIYVDPECPTKKLGWLSTRLKLPEGLSYIEKTFSESERASMNLLCKECIKI